MSEPGPRGEERGAVTVRERLGHAGYATAERLSMLLPEFVGRRVFELGAIGAFHLAGGARRTVARNLRRVLGPRATPETLAAATRESFRSYGRYWYEAFRLRVIPEHEFLARFTVEGQEHLHQAMAGGRGVIVAIPHMGNWDAAGKWVHLIGYPITAVAELLRPPELFELFQKVRRTLGLRIVPLYDDRDVGRQLVKLLGENEVIALVADRDLKGRGVRVEMFGAERRMPAGPALLSLLTGSPLLPAAPYDRDDGWTILFQPPLSIDPSGDMRADVVELTRRLAAKFERSIEAAPTQWHMFQPAWGDPEKPERRDRSSPPPDPGPSSPT
jgi:lauroyl/myristoyl acyltransferase